MQKYDATATTKTHGLIDATLLDVVNPFGPPLDATGTALRSASYVALGWFGRGYKDNKTLSF